MTRGNKSVIKKPVSSYLPSGSKWISVCKSTRFAPRTINPMFPAVRSELQEPFTSYLICHGAKSAFPISNWFSWRSEFPMHGWLVLLWCWQQGVTSWAGASRWSDSNFKPFKPRGVVMGVNVTHLNRGVVDGVSTLVAGAVKQLLPLSLSSIIKVIKAVQCRWYLSCVPTPQGDCVSTSRRCDKCQWAECVLWGSRVTRRRRRCYFCSTLFFLLLRLFPRSGAETPADGECWRGGGGGGGSPAGLAASSHRLDL